MTQEHFRYLCYTTRPGFVDTPSAAGSLREGKGGVCQGPRWAGTEPLEETT